MVGLSNSLCRSPAAVPVPNSLLPAVWCRLLAWGPVAAPIILAAACAAAGACRALAFPRYYDVGGCVLFKAAVLQ